MNISTSILKIFRELDLKIMVERMECTLKYMSTRIHDIFKNQALKDEEYKKQKHAFSLIELSISLTVISLLIGSVFVGKKIRDNAILHGIMEDMSRLDFAYRGFVTLYLEPPGDFDRATTQFNSSSITIANGNNNGYIDNNSSENSLALQHLALAGYIQGNYCGSWTISSTCQSYMPSRAFKVGDGYYFASTSSTAGANFAVFDNNANNSFNNLLVYARLFDQNADGIYNQWPTEATYSVLSPLDMFNIDNKYDDGIPNTGNILAASGSDVSNGCVVSGSYVMSNTIGCYFATIVK